MAYEDDAFTRAHAEAVEVFSRLGQAVERRVEGGETQIPLLDVVREIDLEIDEGVLRELHLPPFVPVIRYLPWYHWFPHRPLWCWWWHLRYPYVHCCNWWWWRCHWWGDYF